MKPAVYAYKINVFLLLLVFALPVAGSSSDLYSCSPILYFINTFSIILTTRWMGDLILGKFFAPWCGHVRVKLMAKFANSPTALIADVDKIADAKSLCAIPMVSVNTLGRGHNHIVTLIVSVLLLVIPPLPKGNKFCRLL